jgi:hypothetical protein
MGRLALALLAATALGTAGEWEIGVAGGAGFVRNVGVTGARGTATTGLEPGWTAGVVAGQTLHPNVSGEVRYTFRDSNLKLTSGGTKVTFSGLSHVIHYDVLVHPARGRSRMQPFVAAGLGARVFRGTGTETAFQPLSGFAVLTKTQEVKPMVSAGAGLKYEISERVRIRAEFRDYLSPFPKQVIMPTGGDIKGWLHDFTPMAGISYTF